MTVVRRDPIRVIACLAFGLAAIAPVAAQESDQFSIDRTEVAAASQRSESTTYSAVLVLGETSPAGAASYCNEGYVASLGFFSMLGNLQVPIALRLDKAEGEPSTVALSWTGAEDRFQIYRSTSPHDVLSPENLRSETVTCDGLDTTDSESVLFYLIVGAP